MSKYIAKRIIYFIPVLFGIVFLVYSIMYLAPGLNWNPRFQFAKLTASSVYPLQD